MSEYKIEAKGGLVIPILDSDPSNPSDGAIWYNSSDNVFKKREDGGTAPVSEADVFLDEVLLDNQSGAFLLSWPTSFRAAVVKYYLERDGNVQVGSLLIATNGAQSSITDGNTILGSVGVSFSSDVSSGNVRLLYSTDNTGFNVSFKYSIRKW